MEQNLDTGYITIVNLSSLNDNGVVGKVYWVLMVDDGS